MSIDYSAEYGIGYRVVAGPGIDEGLTEWDLEEYLYGLEGAGFSVFTTGCCLSGVYEGTYLVKDEPFEAGVDLTLCKILLDQEIDRLGLEVEGEFGLVGGLYIY